MLHRASELITYRRCGVGLQFGVSSCASASDPCLEDQRLTGSELIRNSNSSTMPLAPPDPHTRRTNRSQYTSLISPGIPISIQCLSTSRPGWTRGLGLPLNLLDNRIKPSGSRCQCYSTTPSIDYPSRLLGLTTPF